MINSDHAFLSPLFFLTLPTIRLTKLHFLSLENKTIFKEETHNI